MSVSGTPPQIQTGSPHTISAAHPIAAVYAPSNDAALMMRYDANKKSALIAYLLLFFLGGLAAHRFYLGRTGSGSAMLILSLASWLLVLVAIGLVGLIVVGLWIIVDAFLIPGMTEDYNNRLIGRLRAG